MGRMRININNHYFRKFNKSERSSFPYWFYHWKAFNLVALSLGCWKFKYLFHDIEKPWLKLFLPYDKVQEIHRRNNAHHTKYKGGVYKLDYEAMLIDWECSRFTKISSPRTAREMFPNEIGMAKKWMSETELLFFENKLKKTADKMSLS